MVQTFTDPDYPLESLYQLGNKLGFTCFRNRNVLLVVSSDQDKEVLCIRHKPEGAWNYIIPTHPYPENFNELLDLHNYLKISKLTGL